MPSRHVFLIVVGIVAVAFSSILVRLADAPPVAVAFYRTLFASALLLPLALARHGAELRNLTGRDLRLALASGVLLAVHFVTWFAALDHTTVAAGTALVTTQPVWVGAVGHFFLGERLRPAAVVGIALALGGACVVAGGSVLEGSLLGNALALVGGMLSAGYLLVGRSLRQRVSLLSYVGIVYTTCALVLLPAALASGTPLTGYDGRTWGVFLLLALVPQILGHTVFNYLLAHLEAAVVAVAILGEPVGATLLAFAILAEVPPWTDVLGGAVILAGVYVAITAQGRGSRAIAEAEARR